MKSKFISILVLTIAVLIGYSCVEGKKEKTADWTLVWSDEFDGQGAIDSEKWFHQTQLPPGGSWWGGLLQHYTNRDENAYLKDGHLYLLAKKEEFTDQGKTKQYTAARLNSKFAFTYGRVEVRAKMPKGKGTWPAIWMLNTNIDEDGAYWDNAGYGTTKWPNCGEIDIVEHWGKNQDYVSSAVHNESSYGYNVTTVGGQHINAASDQFHIYALEWTKDSMSFTVDGIKHFTYKPGFKKAKTLPFTTEGAENEAYKTPIKTNETWPYDDNYYLILNIAIETDIDPTFEESPMVVDYIRIYQ